MGIEGTSRLYGVIPWMIGVLMLMSVQQVNGDEERFSEKAYSQKNEPSLGSGDREARTGEKHKVVVYYLHGNKRCRTCKKIERLTKATVKNRFADEIKSGNVVLMVINVDQPENRRLAEDYEIFTKSVIVSDTVNDQEKRWKNLTKIWELVNQEKAFAEYIYQEVKEYL